MVLEKGRKPPHYRGLPGALLKSRGSPLAAQPVVRLGGTRRRICLAYFMWRLRSVASHRLAGWAWLRIVPTDPTALPSPENQMANIYNVPWAQWLLPRGQLVPGEADLCTRSPLLRAPAPELAPAPRHMEPHMSPGLASCLLLLS